ncbi:MAG: AAA family ATPase, partial [Bacteroidota bacterium]
MHTPTKRFIARVLLLSGLLQSCYSPQAIEVPEEAAAESKDRHDIDASPSTRKRKAPTLDTVSAMSSPAAQEPAASHPATTLPKSLRLDATEEPQETASLTALDQAGSPGRALRSVQPEICTGTDRFDKLLLESDVFVDKSLFIKEFLECHDEVSLITRPRRWGKSLNMNMLKCFLSIEVDKQGRPLPPEQSLNRKLFVGGEVVIRPKTGKVKQLFPLKIAQQCPDLISDYQGEYPVISIGFQDVKGNSYQEIEEGIRSRIVELYNKYGYLERRLQDLETTVGDIQQEKLCHYIGGNFSQVELKSSLRFLSELLHKYFGKEVYILIDEYDAPIAHAYLTWKDNVKDASRVFGLFESLLGAALKGNRHLKQGLLTGVFKLCPTTIFASGLNNICHYTLFNEIFADWYGFTQAEVDELLSKVPIAISPSEIQRWYKGYTFGDQEVYNPWSIMCCLSNGGKLARYWFEREEIQLTSLMTCSKIGQYDLQQLVSGSRFSFHVPNRVDFEDILKFGSSYELLVFGGYLNATPIPNALYVCHISIPTYEMRHFYEQRLLSWVYEQLQIDAATYDKLVEMLLAGKARPFVESLSEVLSQSSGL